MHHNPRKNAHTFQTAVCTHKPNSETAHSSKQDLKLSMSTGINYE